MLKVCDMKDVPFKGNPFSWVGRRRTVIVECCLDRVMINSEWHRIFPVTETEYLELAESDHRPMIISIDYVQRVKKGWFRYDKRLFEEGEDTVSTAWSHTDNIDGWNKGWIIAKV